VAGENSNMGLKDWLFRNVVGPQRYGEIMGREAREGGSALANVVFISHAACVAKGQNTIFDTPIEMEAIGYKCRFTEIVEIDFGSLTNDELLLLRSLQTAMISFAFIVYSNAALQYMRRENTTMFRKGLWPSLLTSMVKFRLFDRVETAQTEVLSYVNTVDSASVLTVLNVDRPASGDVLEQFIVRAAMVSGLKLHYGFTRTGLTGFDLVAVPMVQETLKSILGATTRYKW
jgi:hypothetical protein